jgi:hypothetical protein
MADSIQRLVLSEYRVPQTVTHPQYRQGDAAA